MCDSAADEFKFRGTRTEVHQFQVCGQVYVESILQGVPPALVLATTKRESGFKNYLVSSAGAKGPLQVTSYWCKEHLDECNKVEAGVRALRLLRTCKTIDWDHLVCKRKLKTPKSWSKVLCHYNSGNKCYASSRRYARGVLRDRSRLKRRHKKKCGSPLR